MTYTGATGTTSDSITVRTVDSDGSPAVSKTIAVTVLAQDDTPTETAPASITATAGSAFSFTGTNAVSVSDDAVNGETFTVTVTAGTGTLADTVTTGVTGSGSHALTITGSLTQINSALAAMTYTGATGTTSDSITVRTVDSDGSPAVSKTIAVTVLAQDDTPTETAPASITATAGSAFSFTNANAVSVSDDAVNGETFTVTVTAGTGTLADTVTTGVTGSGSHVLTITGSLTQINAALAAMTYTGATGTTSDSITVRTVDSDGSPAVSKTIAVTVTPSGISSWKNPVSGNWNVAGNWTPTGVPGPNSQVQINVPGYYAINSTQDEMVGSLTIGDTAAILGIQPGTVFTLGAAKQSSNAGILEIGGQLNISGSLVNTHNPVNGGTLGTGLLSGLIVFVNGGTISGGILQNAPGSRIICESIGVHATSILDPATLINQGSIEAGVLNNSPLTIDTGSNVITNSGSITGGPITVNSPITNTGSISSYNITLNGAVLNNGSIAAVGLGNVTVNGAITGVGTDLIQNGSTMVFNASVSSGQTVDFDPMTPGAGGGRLILDQAQTFAGTVAGLATRSSTFSDAIVGLPRSRAVYDAIDLANFRFADKPSITSVTGTGAAGTTTNVTITDGALTATLHLMNQYANQFAVNANDYSLTSDNPGSSSAGTLFSVDLAPGHPNH
jgi:hypothetical protein